MPLLARVSFRNVTGGQAEIYWKIPDQPRGDVVVVPGHHTSPPIDGRLLTIDMTVDKDVYSYDFVNVLPNGLWVEEESPYSLNVVLGEDHETLLLVVKDRNNEVVVELPPSGVRA